MPSPAPSHDPQAYRWAGPGDVNAFFGLCDGATFELWGVLEGRATIEWAGQPVTLSGVSWALLPADLGEFQVIAEEPSTLLRVIVPEVDDE
jgi:hypothetical protein